MHECPDCYEMCHCKGDIDDLNFGEWDKCEHWKICEKDDSDDRDEYEEYWNEEEIDHEQK